MAVNKFKLGHIDAFKASTTVTQSAGTGITRSGSWTGASTFYYCSTSTAYITFDFIGTGVKFQYKYGMSSGTYNCVSTAKIEIRYSGSSAWIRYPNVNMYTNANITNAEYTIDMNLPYGSYQLRITHNGISDERMYIGDFTYYDKPDVTIQDTTNAFTFDINPNEMEENPDFGELKTTASGRIIKNTIGIPTNTITINGMKIDKWQKRKMQLFAQREDILVLIDDKDDADNIHLVKIVNFSPKRRPSRWGELESYTYSMTLQEHYII